MSTTVNLVAEIRNGEPVLESLLVEPLQNGSFRLLRSPGLVQGLAAGDEFLLAASESRGFRLLQRSGNICIQVYFPHDARECLAFVRPAITKLGGKIDGERLGEQFSLLALTIPVNVGFPAIEQLMSDVIARFHHTEWMYGNVYDEDGITPLNWWLE